MTPQSTTIQTSTKGLWILIGAAAASLAVLGGALLVPVRPSGGNTAPQPSRVAAGMTEAAIPIGGLAEQYREAQQAEAAREAARVTTRGGLAELYGEQAAEAPAAVEREGRMGGMAELYRDQAREHRTGAAR